MANFFDSVVGSNQSLNTSTQEGENAFSKIVGRAPTLSVPKYQMPSEPVAQPSSFSKVADVVTGAAKAAGGFVADVGKGFYNQFAHPSNTEQQVEKNLIPGANDTGHPLLNKALDIVESPGKTILKGAIRFIEPALEPFGMDIAQTVGGNQIVKSMQKGEISQEQGGKILNDLAVLHKSAPQIVGDTTQAVLSAYFPSLLKEVAGSDTVLQGLETGIRSGARAGLLFGGAQVASEGSHDFATNAKIFAGSILAGLSLGGATGAVGGALHPDVEAVHTKLEDLKTQMKSPEVKSVIDATQQELKNPSPETLKIAQEKSVAPVDSSQRQNVFSSIAEPTKAVSPDLQPLAEEARKYKTAEEFVQAQPTYTHFTKPENISSIETNGFKKSVGSLSDIFLGQKMEGKGTYFLNPGEDLSVGKSFGEGKIEASFKPGTKILDLDKEMPEWLKNTPLKKWDSVVQEQGYDGVTRGGQTAIYNQNVIKTKSQLTDFYNQATNSSGVTPVPGTGETKTRGLSQGVEVKAIESKLTKGFGDLPEYQTVNMKDQAQRAADLISKDYERAKRIALGGELPPEGTLPESVFVAVENKAIKEGDVNTLRELATNSSLTSEATTMGQRIRTLAERDPESPVTAIKDVVNAREEAAKNRVKGKDLPKAKKEVTDQIKSEIKKVIPTKETWKSFVESLQC